METTAEDYMRNGRIPKEVRYICFYIDIII
jgi:hypothetical protein